MNREKPEPQFESQPKQEPISEMSPETEQQSKVEIIEDFVEPEGKKGKWSEVIENKELGIRYREKIIELPKHRQEETGIKRIRRRELLPPFPEGLYENVSEKEEDEYVRQEEIKKLSFERESSQYEKKMRVPFPYKYRTSKAPNWQQHGRRYNVRGFEKIYDFLTNTRTSDKDIETTTFSLPLYYHEYEMADKHIKNLKEEQIYFQKIHALGRGFPSEGDAIFIKGENGLEIIREFDYGKKIEYASKGSIWTFPGFRVWENYLRGPCFIFGRKNKAYRDYLKSIIGNPETKQMLLMTGYKNKNDYRPTGQDLSYYESIINNIPVEPFGEGRIPIIKHPDIKPFRWCHSEIAIIPTQRSLNVLFFETGDEDKITKKNN